MQHNEDNNNDYFSEGMKHFKKGNLWDGIGSFKKAIKLKPFDTTNYYFRALACYKAIETVSDPDEKYKIAKIAISDLTQVIQLEPEYMNSYRLMDAYYLRAWLTYTTYDDDNANKTVFADFTKALTLSFGEEGISTKGIMVHGIASILVDRLPGDLPITIIYDAILELPYRKQRINLYESCLDTATILGKWIHRKPKSSELALQKIRTQLQLEYRRESYKDGHSYLCHGISDQHEKKFDSAWSNYQKSIRYLSEDIQHTKIDRVKSDAYFQRGTAYLNQCLYANALVDFNHAIHANKDNSQKYLNKVLNVFYRLLEMENEKKTIIGFPGKEYDLEKVYESMPASDLWSILKKLPSQRRLALVERSRLLNNRLRATNFFTKYLIRNTLGQDYEARGDLFYRHNKFKEAIKNYEIALNVYQNEYVKPLLERAKKGYFFHPPMARCYDQLRNAVVSKTINNSAHTVRQLKYKNLSYFFKEIHEKDMAFLEGYANERYRMMLPEIVAPNKAYVNKKGRPIGVNSKGIPKFRTLKDILNDYIEKAGNVDQGRLDFLAWFNKYLSKPENYQRFLEILAVAFYRCEDDLHLGNIAINEETGELFLFDTDCSMWPVMVRFKGKRFGVDSFNFRNPKTAFNLSMEDIVCFPHLRKAKPHYFPGRYSHFIAHDISKPIVEKSTSNLYFDDLNERVQQFAMFDGQKRLDICFNIWISDMLLYKTNLFYPIAALYIPKDAERDGKNIIELIVEFETKRNEEFWETLPLLADFQVFLSSDKNHSALYRSLLNYYQHNQKLEKRAKKYPERAKEFKAAMFPLGNVIENYNKLIDKTNKAAIFTLSKPIPRIDPDRYLRKFKTDLVIDLIERENNYDNWLNKGKQKINRFSSEVSVHRTSQKHCAVVTNRVTTVVFK